MMDFKGFTHNSKLIQECEFSWTIDNFSRTFDVLDGPSIVPVDGYPENVCLKLTYSSLGYRDQHFFVLDVSLAKMDFNYILIDAKDRYFVSSYTTIRKTNNVIIQESSTSNIEFKYSINLLKYTSRHYNGPENKPLLLFNVMNLLDDKLVVKGKLTFYRCDLANCASPLLVEYDSACGEVLKNLKAMYEDGLTSDITFSVGGNTLRAHKNILVSRSPVFARMFDNDMKENHSHEVVIEDAYYHVFNCFLMFLYTGIVQDKGCDTVLALYSLAHKYQVKSLHSVCSGILGKSMTVESVCRALVLSDLHDDQKLKESMKVFIRHHITEVENITEWTELVFTKPQLVKEILASTVSSKQLKDRSPLSTDADTMSRYKKHNCVSSPKEAEAVSNRNREDRRKKIGTKDPLVQTTKRLFDVGDEERHQHYQEAYLEAWKGRIARESVAADSEYYKFTLDPPPDNHMRTPQQGDSFYYIPEQHLQWTWREGRLKKRDPNIVVMVEETSPTSRPHLQTSVKHKYAFDNGIYKILIR